MSYYDYEDYYNEPSEADAILEEAKQRIKEVLNNDIKQEIEFLKTENERLNNELEEYKEQVKSIHDRETTLESRAKNLERDIIRRKFSEILKPIIEKEQVYRVAYRHIEKEKCDRCNDERMIVYTSQYGDVIEKPCECSGYTVEFFPDKIELEVVSFYKDGRKITCKPKFEGKDYDDTYCKLEFERYLDKYDDKTKELSEYTLKYNCVWTNKEECQKYCDYLNKKNGITEDMVEVKRC